MLKTILISAVALTTLAIGSVAHAQTVTITLTGVEARGGQILATLQTEGDFMQPRGTSNLQVAAPSSGGPVTLTFENVPAGSYAFSAFHDVNSDYQMQREANGYPQEGWAMSNGAALRAAPTFGQVSFAVGAAPVARTEPMTYPQAH
jgi:uncharacterized protein (DUF2141 family)